MHRGIANIPIHASPITVVRFKASTRLRWQHHLEALRSGRPVWRGGPPLNFYLYPANIKSVISGPVDQIAPRLASKLSENWRALLNYAVLDISASNEIWRGNPDKIDLCQKTSPNVILSLDHVTSSHYIESINRGKTQMNISILVSHATAHCALATSSIQGTVIAETAKAVKVQSETEKGKPVTCWFPRSALTHWYDGESHTSYKLKPWCLKGWTQRFVELTERHSFISA